MMHLKLHQSFLLHVTVNFTDLIITGCDCAAPIIVSFCVHGKLRFLEKL